MKTVSHLSVLMLILIVTNLQSQMYILNEDFNSANDTTPPLEWSNITLTGEADDLWHFDNPGDQDIGFPIIAPFAIFDAAAVSDNKLNYQRKKQLERDIRKVSNQISKVEENISSLEEEITEKDKVLSNPADHPDLDFDELSIDYNNLNSSLEKEMQLWEELHAKLEDLKSEN